MIVKTRYRDIPWEEARKCFTDSEYLVGGEVEAEAEVLWTSVRGTEFQIASTPSTMSLHFCRGPWYHKSNGPRGPVEVCPHIAEIGD